MQFWEGVFRLYVEKDNTIFDYHSSSAHTQS